ncbi:MAG: hypothetical protein LBH04_10825 [Tannerellaceae bacterium]|jgi:hypothetical protein|nr:hypothetical protein [Tannerellaceae bacterium]
MNIMMSDFEKELRENLFPIYDKAKRCIIYAERLNPNGEIPLAPINEMRNALDRIFKASQLEGKESIAEIKRSKAHLEKAGYDSFEILANQTIITISKLVEPYEKDGLTAIFPEYYREIKPAITNLQSKLENVRTNKEDAEKDFESYFSVVKALLAYKTRIETAIVRLEEFKKKVAAAEESIRYINDTLKPYDNECLSTIIPEYSTEIRAAVNSAQSILVKIHARTEGAYEELEAELPALLGYREKVAECQHRLEEYTTKDKKRRNRERSRAILFGICGAAIGAVAAYFYTLYILY